MYLFPLDWKRIVNIKFSVTLGSIKYKAYTNSFDLAYKEVTMYVWGFTAPKTLKCRSL